MPAAVLGALWFMAVADTRFRMPHYVAGAVAVVVSNLVPVVFGFSLATLVVSVVASTFAGAFCFETIMKVWTQESFPDAPALDRQGTVYGVARFATAGLNVVTPTLLALDPRGVYLRDRLGRSGFPRRLGGFPERAADPVRGRGGRGEVRLPVGHPRSRGDRRHVEPFSTTVRGLELRGRGTGHAGRTDADRRAVHGFGASRVEGTRLFVTLAHRPARRRDRRGRVRPRRAR